LFIGAVAYSRSVSSIYRPNHALRCAGRVNAAMEFTALFPA